jgi:hypothetical protein
MDSLDRIVVVAIAVLALMGLFCAKLVDERVDVLEKRIDAMEARQAETVALLNRAYATVITKALQEAFEKEVAP